MILSTQAPPLLLKFPPLKDDRFGRIPNILYYNIHALFNPILVFQATSLKNVIHGD